jgi:2-polyprenyl-6-methoxyphenol hydroxylase-like FAD-dependent oxidoreductase
VTGRRVAVVGAGLGGLCLAQGLHRAGADVAVYERDAALASRPQGYRLHVDARAGLALQRCLPPELFELFLATCGRPGKRFTVLSERLRVLHEVAADPAEDPSAPATLSTSANRQTLREILAAGLGQQISFGREFTRYEAGDDGVRLHFADGRPADADLLVGADGVNSAVRRQRLPGAGIIDTGSRCIYGKTLLDDSTLRLVPPSLLDGFTAIVGGPVGMAAGLVQFSQRPERACAAMAPEARLSPAGDYLMWAVSANHERFGVPDARLGELGPAGLHDTATKMIRSWHPDLRGLVARASIDETFLVRIRTSVPVAAWPPSRVTLLGDAIHAMSPARGSGANTALQDAGLLCRTLTEAWPDGRAVGPAISEYETRMREYGYAAVRASRAAETGIGARRGGAMFWLYRHLARPKASPSRK